MPYNTEDHNLLGYLLRLTGKTLFVMGLVFTVLMMLAGFWPSFIFVLLLLLGAALLSLNRNITFNKMKPAGELEEKVRALLHSALSPRVTNTIAVALKTALLTFLALITASLLLLLLAQGAMKRRDTLSDGREITRALNHYYQRTNTYPGSLSELISKNPLRKGWEKDGWGNPYRYSTSRSGTAFLLTSSGKDGQFLTGDDLVFPK